jgi:hypothetical protein
MAEELVFVGLDVAKKTSDLADSISVGGIEKCINEFREQNKDKSQTYEGDLEADHLGFLAKVRKASKYE